MTSIAIIGFGNMGKGLAARLAGRAPLIIGVRDASNAAEFAGRDGVVVSTPEAAAAAADIVLLAMPYDAALDFAANPVLAGKIVIDMSNPVTADYSGLKVGGTTSAAEEIQKIAGGSRVVKAFNTIFAGLFDAPRASTASVPVFVAGGDAVAVAAVADLVTAAGFRPELIGGLDGSRLVEPVGMLNIRLGYGLGRGTNIAPSWVDIAA